MSSRATCVEGDRTRQEANSYFPRYSYSRPDWRLREQAPWGYWIEDAAGKSVRGVVQSCVLLLLLLLPLVAATTTTPWIIIILIYSAFR